MSPSTIPCLVFAKPPGHPAAKTRLASSVGRDGASLLARAFLADTWSLVEATPSVRPVLVTTDPAADHGLGDGVEVWDQGGGDLGARLERAFTTALSSAPGAIAIGADAPGMPTELLGAAVDGVRHRAAVLGPAEDGGFWALGLRSFPRGMLCDVPWSTSSTAEVTRARLRLHGLDVADLPSWWDIDTATDLARWRREIPRTRAAFTHAALDALCPPEATARSRPPRDGTPRGRAARR